MFLLGKSNGPNFPLKGAFVNWRAFAKRRRGPQTDPPGPQTDLGRGLLALNLDLNAGLQSRLLVEMRQMQRWHGWR